MRKTRIQNQEHQELLKQRDALEKWMRHMALIIGPLDSDYKLAGQYWREDKQNRQFWSRTVLRCLCANIEARLFIFRRTALEVSKIKNAAFTKEELETLTEARTVLQNGVQTTKSKWLPIKDAVKEALRLFAKAHGATFVVDCGTTGCRALCDTFDVRHRLMHPKDVFAIGVSDEDITAAEKGISWLNEQYQAMLDECRAQLAANIERERAKLGITGK